MLIKIGDTWHEIEKSDTPVMIQFTEEEIDFLKTTFSLGKTTFMSFPKRGEFNSVSGKVGWINKDAPAGAKKVGVSDLMLLKQASTWQLVESEEERLSLAQEIDELPYEKDETSQAGFSPLDI